MNIIEFEQMALKAVKESKITDFEKLVVHFSKWSGIDSTASCYVCLYPGKGAGQSAESEYPKDAIREAVQKLERQ